ncbi:MAG: hypothetical protein JWQ98_1133 [Chlorobi bacterium]|nr:hypothetical protein [Chlorobiota bacterium]
MEHVSTVSEKVQPKSRLEGVSREELARIAYVSVEELPFLEMNDGNRLGFHVYLYINGEIPSLSEAIYEAHARTSVHPADLERIIAQRLYAAGVNVE